MTESPLRMPVRFLIACCILFLGTSWNRIASAAPVLTVIQLEGEVQVEHLGETRRLVEGDDLRERDVIRVGPAAAVSMRFGAEGSLALGAATVLAVERLPESDDAPDLRSIFSLSGGYLHVVWKRPPPPARWPLFVYFAGQRASLVDGEYFFSQEGGRVRSCLSAGRILLTSIAGGSAASLRPSACYEREADGSLKTEPRTPASWVAVRQAVTLNPRPGHSGPVFATVMPAPVDAAALDAAANEPDPLSLPAAPIASAAAERPAAVREPAAPAVKPSAEVTSSVTTAVASDTAQATRPAAAGGSWVILVGSYADAQNAAQIQEKLLALGLTPFLRVKIVDGKTWNSVQVRGFPTREAAAEKQAVIQAKLGLQNLMLIQLH